MRMIILAGCILIFLACIFPPWSIHYDGYGLTRQYNFLFTPPKVTYYSLDLKVLFIQVLVIIAFTGAVVLLVKKLK